VKNVLLRLCGVILLIVYIIGCAPSRQFDDDRVLSADRLIKRLEANRRKVKTFRGTGLLNIQSNQLNAKSNFEVMVKKPDTVKVSFYGPFNIDLAQVLITPTDFQFYDIINNSLYTGKLREGIMKQILKVDMSFDEVLDALTGSVNLTDKLRSEPDLYETTGNNYRLTYIDSVNSINRIFLVRANDLAISSNILKDFKNNTLVEGNYSAFRNIEEVSIPFEINMNDIINKQKLRVEYRTIEVNKNVDRLRLDLPNDVRIIEW